MRSAFATARNPLHVLRFADHAANVAVSAKTARSGGPDKHMGLVSLALAASCLWACSHDQAEAGTAEPTAPTNSSTPAAAAASANTARPTPATAAPSVTATAAAAPAVPASASTPAAAGPSISAAGSGSAAADGGNATAGNAAAGAGPSAAAGNAGSATANAAGSGSAGTAGAAAPSASGTGTLPEIMDPTMMGSFAIKEADNVGPDMQYTTIEPKELGQGGLKHPILIWGPGAGSTPAIYQALLNHIASHGFVIVSYNSTPQGPELNKAIDWIVDENKREGSPYAGKLDTTKIAMGGQSAGSLATFQAGKDQRLTTTVHINGGTFNHGDVANLIKPAFFVCGDDPSVTGGDGTWESDLARPNCDADFMNAKVPVWYGIVVGSSHTTVIDNPLMNTDDKMLPLKKQYMGATVAWLRWQLAGDLMMKSMFVGPSCGYCTQSALWKVQQKDIQ